MSSETHEADPAGATRIAVIALVAAAQLVAPTGCAAGGPKAREVVAEAAAMQLAPADQLVGDLAAIPRRDLEQLPQFGEHVFHYMRDGVAPEQFEGCGLAAVVAARF